MGPMFLQIFARKTRVGTFSQRLGSAAASSISSRWWLGARSFRNIAQKRS